MSAGLLNVYLGGVRSGKSRLAQAAFAGQVAALGLRSPVYLGTLLGPESAADQELTERLTEHRRSRPESWATVEVDRDLLAAGQACRDAGHDAWFLDGLGAWAALQLHSPQAALAALGGFLALARQSAALTVLVLDEVGQGGVAMDPVARAFADLNGSLNQAACGEASEVQVVQAGLVLRLK
ncbi:MAG TPA: bifunctional adenosylcobinamide kinase/adenosylcobinamide-phosphate guanylyltransferase [bacterium]|nr:bifunctional adenosylcobinamide kinase/adenosylcobinamide-phosphate guanylyltransferase [bacterium]